MIKYLRKNLHVAYFCAHLQRK